jgi:large subunit ribosomal protein L11
MAQTIKVLVEAGKANAGPPLGPALGPTGINVGQVVAQINEKTKAFAGMKLPVEVIIGKDNSVEIKTGSPPVSQMILKELNLQKLSGNPKLEKVGNLSIEQVIKLAQAKLDSLNCLQMKSAVKTMIGTCVSIGVLVEGMEPADAIKAVNEGRFDTEINEGRTEMSSEKKALMAQELTDRKAELAKEMADLKAEEEKEKPTAAVVDAEGKASEEAKDGDAKEGEKKESSLDRKAGDKKGEKPGEHK